MGICCFGLLGLGGMDLRGQLLVDPGVWERALEAGVEERSAEEIAADAGVVFVEAAVAPLGACLGLAEREGDRYYAVKVRMLEGAAPKVDPKRIEALEQARPGSICLGGFGEEAVDLRRGPGGLDIVHEPDFLFSVGLKACGKWFKAEAVDIWERAGNVGFAWGADAAEAGGDVDWAANIVVVD